jgi:hypothetical protein
MVIDNTDSYPQYLTYLDEQTIYTYRNSRMLYLINECEGIGSKGGLFHEEEL